LLFEEEEPDFEEALELADEDVPEEEPPPEEPVAVVEEAGVGELLPLSEEEDWDWLSFLDSELLASVGVPLFSDLL
jgi:hypothetical protein